MIDRRLIFFSAVLLLGIVISAASAQTKTGDAYISNGVFISNPKIKEVCDFWQAYLHSRSDSLYDNSFWNEGEKHEFPTADLLTQTHLGNIYSLMVGYKPTILSITPEGEYYKIRTLFAQTDSGFSDPVAITNVYAKKEKGTYHLYNSLPIVTTEWQHHTIGSITFICPKYHQFDRNRAGQLSNAVDSIAHLLHEQPKKATYYFADTKEELYHAQGLDYFLGEGNKHIPSGYTDTKNRILYGAGSGEWYLHEFVHLYANPKFATADEFMLEGLAVFFGGSRGHSLDWLICHGDSLFKADPSLNIDSYFGSNGWENATLDYEIGSSYLFGGLLCKLVYDKGGIDLLLKVMNYGPDPENGRYKILKELFTIDKQQAGTFIKQKLSEYALKVSSSVH